MENGTVDQNGFFNHQVKLDTLIRLRWLAVAGQTVAILIVHYGFKFPMPIGYCYVLVAISAWLNVILKFRWPSSTRLPENGAAMQLAYDILQLGGLLYLTGGLGNPFAFLLLAPVMVSATALSARNTIFLAVLAGLIATILAAYRYPLPWFNGAIIDIPVLYLVGVWVSLICSMFFMATYALQIAKEARQLSDALAASDMVLAHQQHLSALDGLATAAAHELGTPLGTIYLTAKELATEFEPGDPLREDAELVYQQAQRCREILKKLTSLSSDTDQHFTKMPLTRMLDDIADANRGIGVHIDVVQIGEGAEPVGERNPGVQYGLGNLVENAVDFADAKVMITADWNDDEITVIISDDGPGFAPDILSNIGEPYVSRRGRSRGPLSTSGQSRKGAGEKGGGLGLGFFIAKTLLERSGARLVFGNKKTPEKGAVIEVRWPRSAMNFRDPNDIDLV
ncbi:ActS/PrrB/RegB family redox-sensitive histidine kinase [Rhodobacteraceae bacterium RKSG542]|uniref:ActS/PrrB/RegB family redox-sensitive histidine kinase n=1 Tax=Pseudovibrio flavus TaxID=2529854 RepID=UPI0012BD4A19|nr:ActS/PrrB/RegB family redox-sensitive histidine kinase [Pseudovibrio flavus]MTI17855.1 ActS/PrrB/RegB family redox-sensitive histidine kinase [Pseudovibrio flavus]